MTKLFYDHLLIIEEIILVLDGYELTHQEKSEFIALIDETLNHHILNEILVALPKKHHKEFLIQFTKTPHDHELMLFLKKHARGDIEMRILRKSESIKRMLLDTIQKTKKNSQK